MKNRIKTLVALAAFGALALGASAQPALKLLIVDMAKLYDGHYKTAEFNAKLRAQEQAAAQELEIMNKTLNELVEQFKAMEAQLNNPALSNDAKTKAQESAQKKAQEIQAKQEEGQGFIQHTRNQMGQQHNTFRAGMIEEISKVATDIAKRRGATLLLEKTGPTGYGIPPIIYSDPAYEITEEVAKELNKDRPATAPAPTAAAPAGSPAPTATPAPAPAASSSGASAPEVRLPSLPAKK